MLPFKSGQGNEPVGPTTRHQFVRVLDLALQNASEFASVFLVEP